MQVSENLNLKMNLKMNKLKYSMTKVQAISEMLDFKLRTQDVNPSQRTIG